MSLRFPGAEPVGTARNTALIESAARRPFQSAFGDEIFSTLSEKAAALFHALIADHPFQNGCKRTAVIAVDLFLAANLRFLALGNDEMYQLAKQTATYRERGQTQQEILAQIRRKIDSATQTLWDLMLARHTQLSLRLIRVARAIQKDRLNQRQPGQ